MRTGSGWARLELLEPRALLALLVNAISPAAGTTFRGPIASFQPQDLAGPGYSATIDWGDSSAPDTTVPVLTPVGSYQVVGNHTYAKDGTYVISVTVTNAAQISLASHGTASVQNAHLTVSALNFTATAGTMFKNTVATFTDFAPDQPGQYVVSIDWGDGSARTDGSVAQDGTSTGFRVIGSHIYTTVNHYAVTVKVTNTSGVSGSDQSTADVIAALDVVATPLQTVAGAQFTSPVGSFWDPSVKLDSTQYIAAIDWGDGKHSPGVVTAGSTSGAFVVTGTHIYASSVGSPYQTKVTVYRSTDGVSGVATGVALVYPGSAPVYPFTGSLNPLDDTGVSNSDGITRNNQPRVTGTAAPYALIQLYGQSTTQSTPLPFSSTVASSGGQWTIQTPVLTDGRCILTANVIPATGAPLTAKPVQNITIDTVGPRVTWVGFDPRNSTLVATYRDDLSGLDSATTLASANYNLLRTLNQQLASLAVPQVVSTAIIPTDPNSVKVGLNAAYLKQGYRVVRIVSGGVCDVAGNPLSGQNTGRLPSGVGNQASNFVASLGDTKVVKHVHLAPLSNPVHANVRVRGH